MGVTYGFMLHSNLLKCRQEVFLAFPSAKSGLQRLQTTIRTTAAIEFEHTSAQSSLLSLARDYPPRDPRDFVTQLLYLPRTDWALVCSTAALIRRTIGV